MKLIYICSPLRGNIEENIQKANEYSRNIALQGDCPIAPHCVFTQFLNDNVAAERQMGIDMGLELLNHCDELLVCGDRLTEGMQKEISTALHIGITVRSQVLSITYIINKCSLESEMSDNDFEPNMC